MVNKCNDSITYAFKSLPLSHLCFLGKIATAVKFAFPPTVYWNQAERRTCSSLTDFTACLCPWTSAEWSQSCLSSHASPPHSVHFPTLQEQWPSLDLSFPASYYSFLKFFCSVPFSLKPIPIRPSPQPFRSFSYK